MYTLLMKIPKLIINVKFCGSGQIYKRLENKRKFDRKNSQFFIAAKKCTINIIARIRRRRKRENAGQLNPLNVS